MKHRPIGLFLIITLCLSSTVAWADSKSDALNRLNIAKEAVLKQIKQDTDTEAMRSPVFVKMVYRGAREANHMADRLPDTYANVSVPGFTPLSSDQMHELADTYKKNSDFGLTEENFADKVKNIKNDPLESYFALLEMRKFPTDNTQSTDSKNATASTPKVTVPQTEDTQRLKAAQEQQALQLAHQKELRKQLGRRSFLINLSNF